MKPELSQKEMAQLSESGKEMLWSYNTLYQIDYSKNLGSGEYYLREVTRKHQQGIGVTRKGRFVAMDTATARSYL